MFPNQMIGIPGELVLPAHAHGVEVFLVEPPAGRWRARFVVLRQERHMAKVAEVVAPTLRQFHLLPPLAPSPYKLRVRTTADGRTAVQAFAPIYEMVVENITSPASAELVGDWLGGGLDNARDAVRAKLAELDGTNSHGKSENSSNQSPK
jgi:hypothetical protein